LETQWNQKHLRRNLQKENEIRMKLEETEKKMAAEEHRRKECLK
jgi:GrpB-like predicted nucleotidyltransferase (UPF0157 family)